MSEALLVSVVVGLGCVALGLVAWLRPYERNPFRLRPTLARRLPDRWDRAVPKVLGAIFIGAGVYALLGGA